jgi:hypothetical protein
MKPNEAHPHLSELCFLDHIIEIIDGKISDSTDYFEDNRAAKEFEDECNQIKSVIEKRQNFVANLRETETMWYTLEEKKPEPLQDVIIFIDGYATQAFYSDKSEKFLLRDNKLLWLLKDEVLTNCLWTELPTKKANTYD